jgi:non-specific serine/threonine protein kinase
MATEDAQGSFGALLQRHRLRAGLSQEELAERAGLSRRGLTDLERGARRSPHPGTVRRLADALELAEPQREALLLAAARSAVSHAGESPPIVPPRPNLPASVTSFVGRSDQIDEVRRLIHTRRALTLVGTGGVGKTRMAVHVASASLSEHAGGARLVELAPLAEPRLLMETVAAALGVPEQPGRPLAETLADALRPNDMLLLLDNCEHLVGACAELVSQLLQACPRLGILATSREPLGFAGEAVWRVPSLRLPEDSAHLSLEELLACEAVSLFVERAMAVQADFTLSEQNASAVAQLCRLLDGLPLAIELAAAWTSTLAPQQIVTRLDALLAVAVRQRTGVPPRHQSLRATIDWSYGRLTVQEQRLFSRLSVFAGGWTLAAAEAVCASDNDEIQPGDVLPLLARLVDKSLVQMELVHDEARYRLLEVLRQYAQEQLEGSDEAELTRSRHALFYVDLAVAADPELWGPELDAWQARLKREIDNLRVGLRWLIVGGHVTEAQRMGAPLARFCQVGNYLSEGRAWIGEILTLPGGEGSVEHARVLIGAGLLDTYLANYADAQANLKRAVEVCRPAGDDAALATGLWGLGFLAWGQGDYQAVGKIAEEGLRVSRRARQPAFEALHLFLSAVSTIETGDRAEARALANQSVAVASEAGGYLRAAPMAMCALGALGLLDKEYAAANAVLEQALKLFGEVQFEVGATWALGLLSRVAAAQNDSERALDLATQGLRLALALKLNARVPWCLEEVAEALASAGQFETAVRLTAAATVLRLHSGTRSLPSEDILRKRWLEPTRRALGPRADTVWAEGLALTPRQAINAALGLAGSPG